MHKNERFEYETPQLGSYSIWRVIMGESGNETPGMNCELYGSDSTNSEEQDTDGL